MNKTTALSVIIPFYNETAFIETAVNSVLSQGIDDLEVVIVNDNPDLFDQAYFDSLGFPACVRVAHHEVNRGLPSSRNTGVATAKGRHIAFLDADDYYLPQGLRNHLDYALHMGAEITHAQTVITHVNRTSGFVIPPDGAYLNKRMQGRYEKQDVVQAGFYIESSWASIYTAEFLKGKQVRFDESQVKFEDRIFVIEALLAADSLAIMGEPARVWRKRNDSITTSAKSYEDQLLKFNLVRKSVDLWLEKGGTYARHRAMSEFTRQVGYMITKNETSPWYGAFGFSDDPSDLQLTEMLTEYFARLEVTEHDIVSAFDAKSPKYHAHETGRGKITPHDLFRFADAVARADYALARDLVNATVKRPQTFALPHLPHPQAPSQGQALEQGKRPRILLHFGLHKTGSTHIQYQLAENRRALRDLGILFPQTGFGFAEGRAPVRPRGLPGHQALVSGVFQNNSDLLNRLHGEILGAQCDTVIISAENLSQPDALYPARARRVRKMVEALNEIGDVVPVIMYRQPDSWLESYYREISGNGANLAYQTPGEFLVNNKILLHFGDIVRGIEDACQHKAVLFSFEEALRDYDDLTFAFLDKCGLSVPSDQLNLAADTQYPSTCNAQLQIARITSLLVKDQPTRQNILRTFYGQVEDSGQKSKLFTPRERHQIIDTFCDYAQPVFEAHGIEDPRTAWHARVKDSDLPQETVISEPYMNALWVAGVMNGTGMEPVALMPNTPPEPLDRAHVTEVSLHDLDRISQDRAAADHMAHDLDHKSRELDHKTRELDYMHSSVSWRITAPLRSVMRGYKRLRGRA